MEICNSPFYLCNICIDPLSKEQNISSLNTINEVIKTSIGPFGKLKLVRNSTGGHTTTTSISVRFFSVISIKNPFVKLIISSANSHIHKYKDAGLRCALFTLSLIGQTSLCDVPYPLLAALHEHFMQITLDIFKSEDSSCISEINFSSLQPMKSVVETIFSSKSGCLLTENSADYLCNLLLKAFLTIFPSPQRVLDCFNIRFVTIEGKDVQESKLLDGLLIKIPKVDSAMIPQSRMMSAKVVLFTISLSGEVDLPVENFKVAKAVSLSGAILKHLKLIIQKVISESIQIVFCQKVIHPSLKKQLNDAGVAAFDQLGAEVAGYLQYILGSNAISSLFMEISSSVISYSIEEICKKCYLLLNSPSHPFCSIILSNYNEESLMELKVVCQQAIAVLFQLLKNPKVCYGAGCTETYTAIILIKKINRDLQKIAITLGCTHAKILSALDVFVASLINMAISPHQLSKYSFMSEGVYGHLWKVREGNFPTDQETCACGRFTAANVSDWYFLSDVKNIADKIDEYSFEKIDLPDKFVLLDALDCKMKCLTQGCNTATLLLKTESCISCGVSTSNCN